MGWSHDHRGQCRQELCRLTDAATPTGGAALIAYGNPNCLPELRRTDNYSCLHLLFPNTTRLSYVYQDIP